MGFYIYYQQERWQQPGDGITRHICRYAAATAVAVVVVVVVRLKLSPESCSVAALEVFQEVCSSAVAVGRGRTQPTSSLTHFYIQYLSLAIKQIIRNSSLTNMHVIIFYTITHLTQILKI